MPALWSGGDVPASCGDAYRKAMESHYRRSEVRLPSMFPRFFVPLATALDFNLSILSQPWKHMLMSRLESTRESLSAPDTDEDRHKIKTYVAKYAVDIGAMMNNVPRQMLLLFKANDCLRHLDRFIAYVTLGTRLCARRVNVALCHFRKLFPLISSTIGLELFCARRLNIALARSHSQTHTHSLSLSHTHTRALSVFLPLSVFPALARSLAL